ncbi:NUDIX domain-containing protein [Blastochloris viridis]|uniref:GDP-mannose pyrophosphatase n=1 Tax=Blastochloris viridis TaxID=1079 RepID=A0A0H5BNY0_BLAVI|nr:NUDIX hydrolase [Blastochloris viridis]ALK08308.1 GDP-mannose pyrophosphatase NudK [Blastochloris viridis]BAR98423.1 ADP-ribose pyrophosphatase [Blastochloris viridis]CUU44230.1 GDP-mannose pyrophosphatase nudK [Blastochloris viridis]
MTADTPPRFRLVRTDRVHDGWAQFSVARYTLEDGTELVREIEHHGDAIAVLPYDPARGTVFLVRQFRAPVAMASGAPEILEACAGCLEPGEDAEACARRELEEECGLTARTMDRVATLWTIPGISTERVSYFLAEVDGSRRGRGGGLDAEHEFITVVEMPLAELAGPDRFRLLPDAKSQFLLDRLLDRLGR